MKSTENDLRENLQNLEKKMKSKEEEINNIKTKLTETEKNFEQKLKRKREANNRTTKQ